MKYYVYLHIKEDTGEPFYVGKGCGKRCYDKNQRSDWWKRTAVLHGFDVIFLEEGLQEDTSLIMEKYWISRIGRKDLQLGPLVNMTDGGDGVSGGSWKLTNEQRANIGRASKGRKHSNESNRKKSEGMTGRVGYWTGKKREPFTEEHKLKISKAVKEARNKK
jgi:hypothetical protein